MDLSRPLRGLLCPMVTPLRDAKLDFDGVDRLVERLVNAGVDGLFLLGTTGEGPSLSSAMQREFVSRVALQTKGRARVLVAVTDTSRDETVSLARYSADCGADAVVIAPPPYFPLSQEDLAGYIERMLPELPVPLFLYNMPSHTKVSFAVDTVKRLSTDARIHGIKDSSGDLSYFASLCAALKDERPEFSLFLGPEEMLVEAMAMGAHGGVCGGSNVIPELFVALYRACRDGRNEEARELQQIVVDFGKGVYTAGGNYIKSIKYAMSVVGVCSAEPAEPYLPLDPAYGQQVRDAVALAEREFLRLTQGG